MCLAIPGRVEEIAVEDDLRVGRVNFGGVLKRVCLEYVPEVQLGDYTLVHVGVAISKIDQQSADKTLADFRALGGFEQEMATQEEQFARARLRPQSNCLTRVSESTPFVPTAILGEPGPDGAAAFEAAGRKPPKVDRSIL